MSSDTEDSEGPKQHTNSDTTLMVSSTTDPSSDTDTDATELFLKQLVDDKSVSDSTKMDRLIETVSADAQLTPMAQTIILTELMSTTDSELLARFSHSNALEQVRKWLQDTMEDPVQPQLTLALLLLLGHLPMTVKSLQDSGVGKTVNKLRRSSDAAVQAGAADLRKKWMAIASAETPPPVVADPPAKRPNEQKPVSTAAPPVKKAKASHPVETSHVATEDSALDSALSAESTRRKASIKPDHLRPRRPVQPMSISVPPIAPIRAKATSAASPESISGAAAAATSAVASPRPFEAAAPPAPPPRRVQWAPAASLTQVREYLIEDHQKRAFSGFKDQLAFDVEREKQTMMQQRHSQRGLLENSHAPAAEPIGMVGGADSVPQPTQPWKTPPLLPESLWPVVKGDASTERETQRQRRSLVPRTNGLGMSETPAEPAIEDRTPKRENDASTPLIPLERVTASCPSVDTESSACASAGALNSLGPLEGHNNGLMGAGGGMGAGTLGNNMGNGSSLLGMDQQMLQNMLFRGCGMNNGLSSASLGSGLSSGCINGVGMNGRSLSGVPGNLGGGMMGSGGIMNNALGGMSGLNNNHKAGTGANMMGGLTMAGMNGANGVQQRAQGQQNGGGNLTEKIYMQMMLQGNKQGAAPGMSNAMGRGLGMNTGLTGFGSSGGFDHAAARRDPATHPKFRTKPCRYYASSGGCKNGDRCTFLHMALSSEQFAREFGNDGMSHGGATNNSAGGGNAGQYGLGPGRATSNGRLPGLSGVWMP